MTDLTPDPAITSADDIATDTPDAPFVDQLRDALHSRLTGAPDPHALMGDFTTADPAPDASGTGADGAGDADDDDDARADDRADDGHAPDAAVTETFDDATQGGGGGTVTPTPPETTPPTTTPPTAADDAMTAQDFADLNAYAQTVYGTRFTTDQARALFQYAQVGQDLAALTPEQRLAIQQIINGQTATHPQPAAATHPDAGFATTAPAPFDPSTIEDEYERAVVEKYVAPLQAQLTQLQQSQLSAAERAQAEQIAAYKAAVASAETSWREAHADITDDEWNALQIRASRDSMFPALVQGGVDPAQAARQTYDALYYQTPELVEREVQRRVAAAAKADPVPTQTARAQKAASVSGSSGQAVDRTQMAPQNPADRREWLKNEIARAQAAEANGQPYEPANLT